ncbi:GNAT family N-acetyltransferase [Altererythrobacter sp. GH1-8]|uniref:GNAT family N-acetyltransferase n=1 Tax=Altererythrobacter sp. GH1-8 TaxID=3349333 RepID=UPI00374DE6E6
MVEFRHETDRLILRDWREQDWEPFWHYTNTPNVMRWLGSPLDKAGQKKQQERFLQYRREQGHTFWVVERKDDSELLGCCGLKLSNLPPGPIGMMEVGWRLREDAWGKGYAKESAMASLDLAFGQFRADEVIAITLPENIPSWRLMERLGMRRRTDLDFVCDAFDPAGVFEIVYAITAEEWEKDK